MTLAPRVSAPRASHVAADAIAQSRRRATSGAVDAAAGGDGRDRHANNFDFLRLVAALSVVFSHSYLIAEGSEKHEPFVRLTGNQCVLGLAGVFVFFIISGYLITGSYCQKPAPARFALRRVLRIYPGLAVNILLCALVLGPLVTTLPWADYLGSPTLRIFLAKSLTLTTKSPGLPGTVFVDNRVGLIVNGSLWTLRYEMMMYALVLLLGAIGLLRLSTSVVLLALGILAVADQKLFSPLGDFGGMAWLLGFFASGMAMYFLRDRLAFKWRYALVAVAALALFVRLNVFIMLFPLAGAYLAIGFASRYDRALDYSRYAGDLSYGLYIYGWPAEDLVVYLLRGHAAWWQVFLGGIAVALPLAWLSWHLVEKRALAWRPRLADSPFGILIRRRRARAAVR
jgi:peptidoglycan/LPS O-acetylase OafA/YrhL